MGADGRFKYPKEVWSPAGGWWPYPQKWRSNTAVGILIVVATCVPVFMISEKKMVRYGDPKLRIPWRPGLKVSDPEE